MSVPRTDEEIVADIISFCWERKIKLMDGSYKVEATVCVEHLMRKYDRTKEIIVCIFCNLVKDGYIRVGKEEPGEVYILLDKNS